MSFDVEVDDQGDASVVDLGELKEFSTRDSAASLTRLLRLSEMEVRL